MEAVGLVVVAAAEAVAEVSGHPFCMLDKFAVFETMIVSSLCGICDCKVVFYSLLSFLLDILCTHYHPVGAPQVRHLDT